MSILLGSISVTKDGYASACVYIAGKNRRKLEKILYDAVAPSIKERISDITFSKEQGITVRCSELVDSYMIKKVITYCFNTSSQVYKDVLNNLDIMDIFGD